jgi:hypothetical protein
MFRQIVGAQCIPVETHYLSAPVSQKVLSLPVSFGKKFLRFHQNDGLRISKYGAEPRILMDGHSSEPATSELVMHGSSHGIWSAIAISQQEQSIQLLSRSNLSIEYDRKASRTAVRRSNNELLAGYIQLVHVRIQKGWSCHLLTILFNQLPGNQEAILSSIRNEVERIFKTLVTRTNRNPRRTPTDELPILLGAADLPVHKSNRSSAPLISCNGGLHVHLVLLIPPVTRLKETVVDHFKHHLDLYYGIQNRVQRIHVMPVTENPEKVVDYVLKTIKNRRLDYDEAMTIFPKARHELPE